MLAIMTDNPKKPCVLIIGHELLLGAGVERLLSADVSLYVVGANAPNGAILLEIVKHLQPDTVILDEAYFLTLSLARVTELLACPQLRVITVSASHDRVQMYYQHQLRNMRLADLVHFFRASKKMVSWYTRPTRTSRPELSHAQYRKGTTRENCFKLEMKEM